MIKKFNFLNNFKRLVNNKFIRYLNLILSLISVFYILNFLSGQVSTLLNLNFIALIISITIYIFAIFFLALGWSFLNNESDLKNNVYIESWYYSFLGKYVPFKVGTVLIRYNFLKMKKSETKLSTYSQLILKEQLQIILIASLFSIFFFINVNSINNFVLLNIFLLFYISFLLIKKKKVLICYVSFFYFSFLSLLTFNLISYGEVITSSAFAFILSSLIAFFAVGSPAGIGIREYVSVILLNTSFTEEFILILFIQYRLITVLSDLISYVLFKMFNKIRIKL